MLIVLKILSCSTMASRHQILPLIFQRIYSEFVMLGLVLVIFSVFRTVVGDEHEKYELQKHPRTPGGIRQLRGFMRHPANPYDLGTDRRNEAAGEVYGQVSRHLHSGLKSARCKGTSRYLLFCCHRGYSINNVLSSSQRILST